MRPSPSPLPFFSSSKLFRKVEINARPRRLDDLRDRDNASAPYKSGSASRKIFPDKVTGSVRGNWLAPRDTVREKEKVKLTIKLRDTHSLKCVNHFPMVIFTFFPFFFYDT